MQTFLPYPDFAESLKVLDRQRLGKQRVEAYQIISCLIDRPTKSGKLYTGWKNHPAVKLWRNNVDALRLYYNECLTEWMNRGYKNNMPFEDVPEDVDMPEWLGNEEFHASHRSNLLRKLPEHYGQFGWSESDDLPYLWVNKNGEWYKG